MQMGMEVDMPMDGIKMGLLRVVTEELRVVTEDGSRVGLQLVDGIKDMVMPAMDRVNRTLPRLMVIVWTNYPLYISVTDVT